MRFSTHLEGNGSLNSNFNGQRDVQRGLPASTHRQLFYIIK